MARGLSGQRARWGDQWITVRRFRRRWTIWLAVGGAVLLLRTGRGPVWWPLPRRDRGDRARGSEGYAEAESEGRRG